MRTPLIEFRDVTKRFGTKTILDRINLQIYENQITTIIGKSGTGKSVLLKHIIGLLQPDEGVILFNGTPVNDMKRGEWDRYRSHISYLFQDNALFDSMTVFENVALPLKETTNLGKREIAQRVMTRVEQTELTEVADKYPSELSGGMQKRVALARALVTDPQIVLFDEPTTGQDPIRKNVILSMIAHYRRWRWRCCGCWANTPTTTSAPWVASQPATAGARSSRFCPASALLKHRKWWTASRRRSTTQLFPASRALLRVV